MKQLIIIGIICLAVAGVYFYIQKNVGDIRPALLPSKKLPSIPPPVQQTAKMGQQIDIPLKLSGDYKIGIFAKDLGQARDLVLSPDGTMLVSDPEGGRVIAMPDKNNDGVADENIILLEGLRRPHGIAFFKSWLYVAEEDMVVRYQFDEVNLKVKKDRLLFALPRGGQHFTRSITFDKNGKMFVSLGSTCDVCFEKHPWIAAVIISDFDGKAPEIFAKGLRNAVFLTTNPQTQEIWTTEMGRDFLGDNAPPDEINILKKSANYGWPVCYGNKVYDQSFAQETPTYCEGTVAPVYTIAAHSAPLGLKFVSSKLFSKWNGDLLVAYHGSWNRSTPIGYKVVRLDVEDGVVKSEEDFVTGFLDGSQAYGRPVDMEFDKSGYLYISDDKRGEVYIVSP